MCKKYLHTVMSTETTRLKLLEAAANLLDENAAGVSLHDVARRAGLSRQTLYSHFDSKGHLLVEVVEHIKTQIGFDDLVAPVLSAPTAPEALEAFINLHQRFTPAILAAALAVDTERSRDPEVAKAFQTRSTGRQQLAHHVATRLFAEGFLTPGATVDIVADFLTALIAPAVTNELLHQRGWTVDQLGTRLLGLLRSGLVAYPEPEGAEE